MRSPKDYIVKKAFSLIEIVVVLALLGFVVSFGAVFALSTIERSSLDADRDLYVSMLYESRARALSNVHALAHGVHIDDSAFVHFEGSTYETSDPLTREKVERQSGIDIHGTDIIFAPLTAFVVNDHVTEFYSSSATRTVEVNEVGRIDW